MFSCEYCQISKNTYFEKHLLTAASETKNLARKFQNCIRAQSAVINSDFMNKIEERLILRSSNVTAY